MQERKYSENEITQMALLLITVLNSPGYKRRKVAYITASQLLKPLAKNKGKPLDRFTLAHVLGKVAEIDVEEGRRLTCARVVLKETGLPSEGFWTIVPKFLLDLHKSKGDFLKAQIGKLDSEEVLLF
jgi:hypothetical protein